MHFRVIEKLIFVSFFINQCGSFQPFSSIKIVRARTISWLCSHEKAVAASKMSDSDAKLPPRSMYLHIPFCKQRCHYCDFPVQALGKNYRDARSSNKIEEYVDALLVEIQDGGAGGFDVSFPSAPLETVYIGGGTPSILQPAQIQRILEAIQQRYGIAENAEISMELDPGTFDAKAAAAFRAAGVNRASIGVQSLDDALLRACGRGHTASEAVAAVRAAQVGGFREVSVDLMSGLPGDTLAGFEASLNRVRLQRTLPHAHLAAHYNPSSARAPDRHAMAAGGGSRADARVRVRPHSGARHPLRPLVPLRRSRRRRPPPRTGPGGPGGTGKLRPPPAA